jgi:hypothetical protein
MMKGLMRDQSAGSYSPGGGTAALFALTLAALSGCGPVLLARGNGQWSPNASVVAYPPTIIDESLDPPLGADDRRDFESSYGLSFQQAVPQIVLRQCSDQRPCLHVRVTVRLRQANTTSRTPSGIYRTENGILADAEINLSDDSGRLIELVQIQAHNSGQLGYEAGRYIAARLPRPSVRR